VQQVIGLRFLKAVKRFWLDFPLLDLLPFQLVAAASFIMHGHAAAAAPPRFGPAAGGPVQ
jgi:hypothetical protein